MLLGHIVTHYITYVTYRVVFHFNKLLMDVLAEVYVSVNSWKMVRLGNDSHVLLNTSNTIGNELMKCNEQIYHSSDTKAPHKRGVHLDFHERVPPPQNNTYSMFI